MSNRWAIPSGFLATFEHHGVLHTLDDAVVIVTQGAHNTGWVAVDAEGSAWAAAENSLCRVVIAGGGTVGLKIRVTGFDQISDHIADLVGIKPVSLVAAPKIETIEQVCELYMQRINKIPEVLEVRLVEDGEGPTLWTIISATPFENEPRDRVFSAQLSVMQASSRPLLDFRLINVRELTDPAEAHFEMAGSTIWHK